MDQRPWWQSVLWIVAGLGLGAGLGLTLGWVVWPTEYVDANPAVLQDSHRQEYAHMIATLYAADGDLAQAQQRLAELGPDHEAVLLDATLDAILRGEDEAAIRRLVALSAALGLESPALRPYLTPAAQPAP